MGRNKIVSFLICVACTILLCGCVNVEYQRKVDDLGAISDKIVIELDGNKLRNNGYSNDDISNLLDTIKEDLQLQYINVIKANIEMLRITKGDAQYHLTKNSITFNNDEEVPVKICEIEQNRFLVSVEVIFADIDTMQFAYGIEDDGEADDDEMITEVAPFLTKYIQRSDNIFGDVKNISINDVNFYQKYKAQYPSFSDEDIKLTQVYGTTNLRLKSNADEVEVIDGFKCHLWELNTIDAKTMQLEFYYLTATPSSWYLLALGLSVGVVAVLLVLCFIKKRKFARYRQTVQLEDDEDD